MIGHAYRVSNRHICTSYYLCWHMDSN